MTFTVSAKNDNYCITLIKSVGREYRHRPQNIFAMEVMREKIFIETLEGKLIARKGDYLVLRDTNEIYPLKKEIFKKTYEEQSNE